MSKTAMSKIAALVLLLSTCCFGGAQPAAAPPGFSSFPVDVFRGKPARVKIVSREDKKYSARLRQLSGQSPNFAGHYTLVNWGCGASCIMAAAIDAKTGNVVWLPFTVCCWDLNVREPIEYRLNSRLIVVHGSRNESGSGDYYYEIGDTGFVLIKEDETAIAAPQK